MSDRPSSASKRPKKLPLAALLVARGIFSSPDEAARWIMAGQVQVAGRRVAQPGTPVPVEATIAVHGRERYASRGGHKLEAALAHFAVPVAGRVALDCGASTGGFTDCLLQQGAALVYAVEAGHGQLTGRLRQDPRVRNLERTNLGDPRLAGLEPRPTICTLDLSYLSLTLALPLAARLLAERGEVLALFKPLFEVEDAAARRTGRLDDPALLVSALARALDAGSRARLTPLGAAKLALRPRHGVAEYVLHLGSRPDRTPWPYDAGDLACLVERPGIGPTEV
jgi:23S rRNA (cytidine1920-2'-O)/16S rRNA (cytidine1409-2'-O)-methyltransferase